MKKQAIFIFCGAQVLAAFAYLFSLTVYLRCKNTSGVTWELILRAIRPWLVRSTGCCTCCGSEF